MPDHARWGSFRTVICQLLGSLIYTVLHSRVTYREPPLLEGSPSTREWAKDDKKCVARGAHDAHRLLEHAA